VKGSTAWLADASLLHPNLPGSACIRTASGDTGIALVTCRLVSAILQRRREARRRDGTACC
jgi:hypothetical protein